MNLPQITMLMVDRKTTTPSPWLQTRPVEASATVPRRPELSITMSVRLAQRHEEEAPKGHGRADIS